jgi:hypothetical protein
VDASFGLGCVWVLGVGVCFGIAAVWVGRILWIGKCVFVVENVVEYVKWVCFKKG